MTAKFLFASVLCAVLAASAETHSPRIVSIQLHGTNVVVDLAVPAGIERVFLEGCRRNDLAGWVLRASQRVNGAGEIRMVVPTFGSANMEMFRVRADAWDPLPASFYSGRTEFSGQWLGERSAGGSDFLNGVALSGLGSDYLNVPILLSTGEISTVEDSVNGGADGDSIPSVDRVIPVGNWLVEFLGTEVRVSAVAEPGVSVTRYELDDLPVLGAALEGSRIHVLQGRPAPRFLNTLFISLDGTYPQAEHGLLQHSVIAVDQLPELTLAGVTSMETPRTTRLTEATPLWPEPGLLVWAINGERNWTWNWFQVPIAAYSPHVGAIQPTGFIGVPIFSGGVDMLEFARGNAFPCALVAVDVSEAESPQCLSETPIEQSGSEVSDTCADHGLVFYSHATVEAQIVSTNLTLQTNFVAITVTNLVLLTNVVFEQVIVLETNVSESVLVDASKLRWPEPWAESQFAGGRAHSLGLQGGGKLLAWGDNQSEAVIPGSSVVAQPTLVPLSEPVVRLAAGDWQSYAVDTAGMVWQWGDPNGPTPPWPGEEIDDDFSSPTLVPLPAPIVEIAAGGAHALAIAADGRLWTWGHNYFGELGNDGPGSDLPQMVPGRFATACAGWMHSLAVDTSGHVYSWGWNEFGQLGRSGSPETPARVELPEGIRFRTVAAGGVHSLALDENNMLWGWGDRRVGELGLAVTEEPSPSPVVGLPPIRKVACGLSHSLALAENGEVWFFGEYLNTASALFARVSTLTNVVNIGAGMWHSFALTAGGDLFIWGSDLSDVGGAGDTAQLTLINSLPLIRSRTNYVMVTNIVAEERVEQQMQAVVVSNAVPVYRHLNRHWLDVVDYQSEPERPAVREPASLPGLLQGISHAGALLYTLGGSFDNSPSSPEETRLTVLAYDGMNAHLVDTILLATNSNANTVQIAVDPSGQVVVARDGWSVDSPRSLECWGLNNHGVLEQRGRLELTVPNDALRLIDDLAILRTAAGVELVDLAQPSAPVALPINESMSWSGVNIRRVAGNRQVGLWLPIGEARTRALWNP